MKSVRFAALAAGAALLLAQPVAAGEVNGNGTVLPAGPNAASHCAYSGLNDDPDGEVFPGRVQNFAHFLKWFADLIGADWLHPLDAPDHPSVGCNPTSAG